MKIKILLIAEELKEVIAIEASLVEAYCRGFSEGGNNYGAGWCAAYTEKEWDEEEEGLEKETYAQGKKMFKKFKIKND